MDLEDRDKGRGGGGDDKRGDRGEKGVHTIVLERAFATHSTQTHNAHHYRHLGPILVLVLEYLYNSSSSVAPPLRVRSSTQEHHHAYTPLHVTSLHGTCLLCFHVNIVHVPQCTPIECTAPRSWGREGVVETLRAREKMILNTMPNLATTVQRHTYNAPQRNTLQYIQYAI